MNIGRWLVHSVSRAKRTGDTGSKGDPAYGAPSSIRARVEKRSRRVTDARGNDVVSEYSMATDRLDVALDDVFWFPAIAGEAADTVGDLDKGRTPITIERATTLRGQAPFVVVFF